MSKITTSTVGAVLGYSELVASPSPAPRMFTSIGVLAALLLEEKAELLDIVIEKTSGGLKLHKITNSPMISITDNGSSNSGTTMVYSPIKPSGANTRYKFLAEDGSGLIYLQSNAVDLLANLSVGIDTLVDNAPVGAYIVVSQTNLKLAVYLDSVEYNLDNYTYQEIASFTKQSANAWE